MARVVWLAVSLGRGHDERGDIFMAGRDAVAQGDVHGRDEAPHSVRQLLFLDPSGGTSKQVGRSGTGAS